MRSLTPMVVSRSRSSASILMPFPRSMARDHLRARSGRAPFIGMPDWFRAGAPCRPLPPRLLRTAVPAAHHEFFPSLWTSRIYRLWDGGQPCLKTRTMAPRENGPYSRRELPSDLGARIRAARCARSRAAFAGDAGIAARTLARIERGQQRPTPTTLGRIAVVMGRSLEELAPAWGRDEEERVRSGEIAPGVAVRHFRSKASLTLVELGRASGISASLLSRFERGLLAPRCITRVGDAEFGADSPHHLVITSLGMAQALGFASARDLTRACYDTEVG